MDESAMPPELGESATLPERGESATPAEYGETTALSEHGESTTLPEYSRTPVIILRVAFVVVAVTAVFLSFHISSLKARIGLLNAQSKQQEAYVARLEAQLQQARNQAAKTPGLVLLNSNLQAKIDLLKAQSEQQESRFAQWQAQSEPARNQGGATAGLVILKATYGVPGRTIDVTALVQSFVKNNAVKVAHDWELGRVDPAPGAPKKATILCRYRNQTQMASFDQNEDIVLPIVPPQTK
jgi:hypothetical protein